jgi:DNA-binding CsgD family transcriptional regulator
VDDALATGRAALAAGDWGAARACFERAAERDGSGEALDGLAQALFSEGDYAGAIDAAERAFAAFAARGADVRAAVCARFVGYLYGVVHGNGAAAGGWLGRAVRLIEPAGDCPARARIELTRAVLTADPVAREEHLTAAARIARRCGDQDLVLDAMSQRGLHLVAAGDVTAGMALLDEALAAVAAGEVADLISVGAMYCKMLHACELTCDVRRAEEWLALADGFVARTNRLPISAICRTHYGGVLTAAGRWADAERELVTSLQLYDRTYRALRAAAVVRLATLRVRQGRLAEAAELLTGAEHDSYAIRPRIELHLARDEPDLAVARIDRFFRTDPPDELAAPVLMLLVHAELARHDLPAAASAVTRLAALRPNPLHAAFTAHARGLLAAARSEPDAPGHLESALSAFAALALPLEEARARLDLARTLTGPHPALAVVETRAALECFQRLSATRDADAATSLLRQLGVRGHTAPRGTGTLTTREQEVLTLLGEGLSNPDIAARLYVSRRTAEHHVSNILAKLGLTTRAEAAAYAVKQSR